MALAGLWYDFDTSLAMRLLDIYLVIIYELSVSALLNIHDFIRSDKLAAVKPTVKFSVKNIQQMRAASNIITIRTRFNYN